ncbi:MAG: rubredoxin [Candidatus Pacearchaeota archaeon]
MGRFVCKSCNYRFEREKKPLKCPYCGESSIKEEETAEELLEGLEE